MSEKQDGFVPASTLAQLFDCDEKTIRNLAGRGIVIKKERGKFVLAQSIRNYVRHLREVASGRGGEEKAATLTDMRALQAKEQAEHLALKNKILRRDYVEAIAVKKEWSNIFRNVRALMLSAATEAATRLPHLTRHDIDTLDRIIRDALEDASRGGTADED